MNGAVLKFQKAFLLCGGVFQDHTALLMLLYKLEISNRVEWL